MEKLAQDAEPFTLARLFLCLSDLCASAGKPVVLIIDEVDSASNNQVFLDFLAQLRGYYLNRRRSATFQSVILAGVYDVKNIRRKIRPEEEHKVNSPWNIAADFKVNMSFSEGDIAGMLREYEADHHTGMDIREIAGLLSDYTSGYPFLVSRLCKLMDEDVAGTDAFPTEADAWKKGGFLEAVKLLLSERNTLFESLMGKLVDYPELKDKLYSILFSGETIVYNPFDAELDMARMFGFVRREKSAVVIANRIFETILYDYFLTTGNAQREEIFRASSREKNQYIRDSRLDMELVLTKFVEHFNAIYGASPAAFDEEEGRRRFLLYLRPILNGTGNYYIEAQTRDARRMDVVVDYGGEQFVVELKIWRGNTYNERGERQRADYLDYFKLKKGYLLSYNFNQKKQPAVRTLTIGERTLVEAVV